MKLQKKSIIYMFLAFAFLCLVSLYRIICINHFPDNHVRPVIVALGYTILIFTWLYSVKRRITQKNLRYYIYTEISVMFFWTIIRFLQEFILYKDIYIMRISGYFFAIPIVLIPLFGFFGILGMDKDPDYKISKKWFLLLIPAIVMICLMLTNEYHHFIFKEIPGEPTPNLYFHPNWGICIMSAFALSFELVRIIFIFLKTRNNKDYAHYKVLPFIWAGLIILSIIPYFMQSFVVKYELIEFTALQFFFEAMLWEICIVLGMVPVNLQYEKVFEHSSVAMQIRDLTGKLVIASKHAPSITNEQFMTLKNQNHIQYNYNVELNMHKIENGYLIWQKDISKINNVLQDFKKISEELEEESNILETEIRTQSREARIKAKNKIYDDLLKEVGPQINLLEELIENQNSYTDEEDIWQQICFIATFVKRYCNLGLTLQETGSLHCEDLEFSIYDMLQNLKNMSIKADLHFLYSGSMQPNFMLFVVKTFECLIESTNFNIDEISITIDGGASFSLKSSEQLHAPIKEVEKINKNNYHLDWEQSANKCRLSIWEAKALCS